MTRLRRLVYDTNVIISAVLTPEGFCDQLLQLVVCRQVSLIVSLQVLDEYERVLTRDSVARLHQWTPAQVSALVNTIAEHSAIVEPLETPEVIASDPSDNIFLATAETGRAEFIVSGDRHLLKIQSYQGIEVLRPHEMLEFLRVESTNS